MIDLMDMRLPRCQFAFEDFNTRINLEETDGMTESDAEGEKALSSRTNL